MKKQPKYDFEFAKLIEWLKENNLEWHSPKKGKDIIFKKKEKKNVN